MAVLTGFENIRQYVDYWVSYNELELRDVAVHEKRAYASPAFGNHIVLGGIGFKMYLDGRPIAERQLMQLCCADSHSDGYPASANQIKCAITRWLFDKSKELCNYDVVDSVCDWRPAFVSNTSRPEFVVDIFNT